MSSKKEVERAVQAFEGARELICGGNHKNDAAFSQLTDLVGKYIGYNSEQYAQLKNRNVVDNFYTLHQVEGRQAFYKFDEAKTRATIGMYIDYIKVNGVVEKAPKGNFLSRMKQEVAVASLFGTLSTIAYSGYFIGDSLRANKVDMEKIELRRKLDSLSKSIIAPGIPTFASPKVDTNHYHYPAPKAKKAPSDTEHPRF